MDFALGCAMVAIRHLRSWTLTAGLFLSFLLISLVAAAQAHTDPGSGLLLWQLMVSGLVGFIVFRFRKIVDFLFKRNRRQREK